jgi:glutamate-1-semialdehyde aminotransferase
VTQATGAAMTFEKSALAQARLYELIPGGAHTYARGSDQCPEDMTPILVRGRGARVEDLDGNWLIEFGMALRRLSGSDRCRDLGRGHGHRRARTPFLWGLRSATERHGAVLIFDEIITAMRWSRHGAQSVYGVTPDLSTWGKALGNGFSVSAPAGKRELMEAGGLNTAASQVFLLSTTHGVEATGLAAYLAVSKTYAERDVVREMEVRGEDLVMDAVPRAVRAGKFRTVRFDGFWAPMDTLKERATLERCIGAGIARGHRARHRRVTNSQRACPFGRCKSELMRSMSRDHQTGRI